MAPACPRAPTAGGERDHGSCCEDRCARENQECDEGELAGLPRLAFWQGECAAPGGAWMGGRVRSRRAVALWIGAPVAVVSFVLEGFWLTAAAIAVSATISAVAASFFLKRLRRGEPSERRGSRVKTAVLPIAGISWILAAVADLAAPAALGDSWRPGPPSASGRSGPGPGSTSRFGSVGDRDRRGPRRCARQLAARRAVAPPASVGGTRGLAGRAGACARDRRRIGRPRRRRSSCDLTRALRSAPVGSRLPGDRRYGGGVRRSGGPDGSVREVLTRLLDRAHRAGLRVAIYGGSERHLETYRSLGLRARCVGEEAVVDPMDFTLEGRSVRKLRQSVHRVERRGWQIEVCEGRDTTARWRPSTMCSRPLGARNESACSDSP